MTDLPGISDDKLVFNDAPKIIWIPVQDAVGLLWGDNPKEHDIGLLIQSIQKYGFQELPKYDATLGGIKSGNGRTYALSLMEKNKDKDHYELPRGIAAMQETGAWVMPLLIGTDAESLALARAYAIDANNLTMSGGDFSVYDYTRLWKADAYLNILDMIAKEEVYPMSVPQEYYDALVKSKFSHEDLPDYTDHPEQEIGLNKNIMLVIGDMHHLEEALNGIRKLLEANGHWKAHIEL